MPLTPRVADTATATPRSSRVSEVDYLGSGSRSDPRHLHRRPLPVRSKRRLTWLGSRRLTRLPATNWPEVERCRLLVERGALPAFTPLTT
jgi:hypothetical protein